MFGFGARSPGLAMTGASYGDNYEAAYLNPALLGAVRRRSIVFGASVGDFDLRLDGQSSPMEAARGTTIGFTLPIPFGDVLQDRLTLGAGFYTPTNVLLRGDVRYVDVPQWSVLSRSQSLSLHVGLGFDFHDIVDGLRIGVGVSAMAALIGDLTVSLDETRMFQSVVETQLLVTFAPTFGASYEQPEYGFGLVYRHELRADMNLNIVTMDLPVMLPLLTIGGVIQYDPGQIVAEGYWRPVPDVRLIANLTTRLWANYPGPTRSTSASSWVPPTTDFQNTFSPRIAVEGTLHEGDITMQLRAGYAYEMTPAPQARMAAQRNPDGTPRMSGDAQVLVPLRLIDNDRHIATVGVGARLRLSATESVTFDAYGQGHFLADRTHAVARASSDPTEAAMVSSGMVLTGGWALGLEF
jgi:long-chain fatty acid transport protein